MRPDPRVDSLGRWPNLVRLASLWGVLAATASADIIEPSPTPASLALPRGVAAIEHASGQFRAGDAAACRKTLDAAATDDKTLLPAPLLFAKICLIHRQPAMARATLDRFVVEVPAHPEPPMMLGRMALEEQRWTEAALLFGVGLAALDKDNAKATIPPALARGLRIDGYSGLAIACERRSDWGGAISAWTALLAIDPRDSRARTHLGESLFHRGKTAEAIAEFEKARVDDPRLEPAALIVARLTPAPAAEAAYRNAVARDPDEPRSRLALAQFLAEDGRADEAAKEAEIAQKLAPASDEARFLRAILALDRRNFAEAEAIARSLHEVNPASLAASDLWALALVEQGDEAKALRAFRIAEVNARLYPRSAQALATLGWVEYRRGHLPEAEDRLRAALAAGPASSDAAYGLARALADLGRPAEAISLLDQALAAKGRFRLRKDAAALRAELAKK